MIGTTNVAVDETQVQAANGEDMKCQQCAVLY